VQERVRNGQKSEGGRERCLGSILRFTNGMVIHLVGRDGERAVSSGRERGSRKDRVTKEEE
jgi:hypothetical protein